MEFRRWQAKGLRNSGITKGVQAKETLRALQAIDRWQYELTLPSLVSCLRGEAQDEGTHSDDSKRAGVGVRNCDNVCLGRGCLQYEGYVNHPINQKLHLQASVDHVMSSIRKRAA